MTIMNQQGKKFLLKEGGLREAVFVRRYVCLVTEAATAAREMKQPSD